MSAYYNEHDPKAAAWLRELIKQGHIAPGIVDERDIRDVTPDELREFTQCHFFAGIGVWSYALRRAGWPDDRPVWTGSCPCQPFSAAGRGDGFIDERHLWPHWYHLITQLEPRVLFGEQVASKATDDWIDLVQTDLEALGYAFGAVAFPSAGVGAPHLRDRTYWMGDAFGEGLERLGGDGDHGDESGRQQAEPMRPTTETGGSSGLAEGRAGAGRGQVAGGGEFGGMADSDRDRRDTRGEAPETAGHGDPVGAAGGNAGTEQPGPTNGLWRDADWLGCRDGKWRPVEPGAFPLADGAPARVGRLRGYGNAINAEAARIFIEAYLETL